MNGDLEIFRFCQRLDRRQLSLAQNARKLNVLIDESLDGEHQLIVKRRSWLFWQTTDIEAQRIGAAVETTHQLSAEDRCHSRRQPAIWRERDASRCRLFGKSKFLPHDRVISAEVGEVTTCFNRGPRQPEI